MNTGTARREPNNVTRYLCAGVHLDESFARDVLAETIHERFRAVGPAYGVDLPLVVRHSLSARRRRLLRDLVLTALTVTLLLVVLLPAWRDYHWVIALVLLGSAVVLTETCIVRFEILPNRLRPSSGRFDPSIRTGRRTRQRIARLTSAQAADITVYSGFSPFAGSGVQLSAWSFVIDVGKGKETFGVRQEPQPFEIRDLYDAISASVGQLRIRGLTGSDEVYVNGHEVNQLPDLLPDPYGRPITSCPPEAIQQLLGNFSESIRHYRCFRVTAWGGEMILSLFLRFTAVHGRLFAEGVSCLLAPPPARYYLPDDQPGTPTPLEFLRAVRSSIPLALLFPLVAPFRLLGDVGRCVRRWLRRWEDRLAIANGYVFDYGARASVRARSAGRDYRRYFQKLDQEMYEKYLERQVLDSIVTFLDARGIDTSELVERQTTILNQGVVVSGGSLVAGQLAVGRGAKVRAALRRKPQRAQPATGK